MHETILTACRPALDHQKGKNLIGRNDFHEILAAGQLGTKWIGYYSEKVLCVSG